MLNTVSEVCSYCKENDVRMIDFKMIDFDGRWRHLTIPVERFGEKTMKYGIGFDGSNYGYASVEKSDMVFVPDLSSAVLDPFAPVPTLTMIGDVYSLGEKENAPYTWYPRTVARMAEKTMRALGVADEYCIAPEFEFHMFNHLTYEVGPTGCSYHLDADHAHWNSGREIGGRPQPIVPLQGNYHVILPQDAAYPLRDEMCEHLKQFGVRVKYHHPEVGSSGQYEIEVELEPMLRQADNTLSTYYVIRNAADRAGLAATFMPKPVYNEAGNGLHIHMMMVKDGKNVFYDEKGYSNLSQTALYFMGGILKHIRSLCGLLNPSTNSFRRLRPGFEAPVTTAFATANRCAVIRVPGYAKAPMDKRFELRNADATCNAYYAFAAVLMAGLDGVANQIDPVENGWGPFDFNLFDLPEEEQRKLGKLPTSLGEALDELEKDHEYLTRNGVFPEELIAAWVSRKRDELNELDAMPTAGEFVKYFR